MLFIPLLCLSLLCWAQDTVPRNFIYYSDPQCEGPLVPTRPEQSVIIDNLNALVIHTFSSTRPFVTVGGKLTARSEPFAADASLSEFSQLQQCVSSAFSRIGSGLPVPRVLSFSNGDNGTIPGMNQVPPNFTETQSEEVAQVLTNDTFVRLPRSFQFCGDYIIRQGDVLAVIVMSSMNAARRAAITTSNCRVVDSLQLFLQEARVEERKVIITGNDAPVLNAYACMTQSGGSDASCSYNGGDTATNAAYADLISEFSDIILFQAFGGSENFSYVVSQRMNVPTFLLPVTRFTSQGSSNGFSTTTFTGSLVVTLDESLSTVTALTIQATIEAVLSGIVAYPSQLLDVVDVLGLPRFGLGTLREATLRLYNDEHSNGRAQAGVWNFLAGNGNANCDRCTFDTEKTRAAYACAMAFTLYEDWKSCYNGTTPLTGSALFTENDGHSDDPSILGRSRRLSGGAITGIVLGSAAGAILIILIIVFVRSSFYQNRRDERFIPSAIYTSKSEDSTNDEKDLW